MPIRVFLVDDSALALAGLEKALDGEPGITVVGTARDGREAQDAIRILKPDVVCTDYHMPNMDGLELTRWLMSNYPVPVLVVSISVQADEQHNIFRLLEAGALDVVAKPRLGDTEDLGHIGSDIAQKIRILAGVHVFRRGLRAAGPSEACIVARPEICPRIVAIGASTGGPQALLQLLGGLGPGFALPVLCVQHISEGFLGGLVRWLEEETRMPVRIAHSGEFPEPGHVLFAPEEQHLLVGDDGRVILSNAPPESGHRPSADFTLRSVADRYGATAAGVVLSGMGEDGAAGLKAIADRGGLTFAQSEESCVVFGMPRAAIALGAASRTLSPPAIAMALKSALRPCS